jgi:hypothetical protein
MKRYIVILLLLVSTQYLFAQQGDDNGYDENVIVLGTYNPTLSDANKILLNPSVMDSTEKDIETTYFINSQQIETRFDIKPIKAANLVGESLTKLYQRYLKVGFGNYTTPFFNFHLSNLRSKNVNYGVEILHHSSTSKIKEYAPANFSHNNVLVYGSKLWRKHRMNAQFFFDRDVVHHYGFKPDTSIGVNKDAIRQRYMQFGTDWKYHSTYTDSSRLNHSFNLKYIFLNDIYGMQENGINFNADINKNLELIKVTKSQTLGLTADVNFFNIADNLATTNRTTVTFSPYLSTVFREFEIYLGANACVESDTATEMFFTPKLEVGINVIKKYLVVYGGATGGVQNNAYSSIIKENPFIISGIEREYTRTKSKLYAGIKGGIGHFIDYNISMSFAKMENMPFFIHDTTTLYHNMFAVVYDDVEFLNVHGQIGFNKEEKLSIILEGNFNQISTTNQAEAWYIPFYDASLGFRYHLADKIIVKSDIFMVGERFAPHYDEITSVFNTEKLDLYFDANLGVEYRITKLLSGFLNINNLTASRYYRWYDYPSQRFNVMLGVSYGM